MSKKMIQVTRIEMSEDDTSGEERAIFINFKVFKRGLFGGIKESRSYLGWYLTLTLVDNGEISLDPDLIFIKDGNFKTRPFNSDLVIGVIWAAEMKLREEKGALWELFKQASKRMFK